MNLIKVHQTIPALNLFTSKDPLMPHFNSIYIQAGRPVNHELSGDKQSLFAYSTDAHILAKIDLSIFIDIEELNNVMMNDFEITDFTIQISSDAWKKLIKASWIKLQQIYTHSNIAQFDSKMNVCCFDAKFNQKDVFPIEIQSKNYTSTNFVKPPRYDDVIPEEYTNNDSGLNKFTMLSGNITRLASAFDPKTNLAFNFRAENKPSVICPTLNAVCLGELIIMPVVLWN